MKSDEYRGYAAQMRALESRALLPEQRRQYADMAAEWESRATDAEAQEAAEPAPTGHAQSRALRRSARRGFHA